MIQRKRNLLERRDFEDTKIGKLTIMFFIVLLAVILPWSLNLLIEAFISIFNLSSTSFY